MAAQLQDHIDSIQKQISAVLENIDDVTSSLTTTMDVDAAAHLRQREIMLRQREDRLRQKELILLRSAAAGELFEIIHVRTHHHYHPTKN